MESRLAHVLLYDDVDQFILHDDHLHHLLAGEERLGAGIVYSGTLEIFFWRSKRREDAAAHLSIHLEHDSGAVFLGELFIVSAPRLAEHRARAAELLP